MRFDLLKIASRVRHLHETLRVVVTMKFVAEVERDFTSVRLRHLLTAISELDTTCNLAIAVNIAVCVWTSVL